MKMNLYFSSQTNTQPQPQPQPQPQTQLQQPSLKLGCYSQRVYASLRVQGNKTCSTCGGK